MKVVTWNVNSIRVREERALAWLKQHTPDVLCLQELKVEDHKFPLAGFEELGYEIAAHGQKTYNGVAILARGPIEDVRIGLDDGVDDDQARLIAGTVSGVRILSAYFPNGGEVDGPRYPYKLEWMKRLRDYLDRHHSPEENLLLCGDYNVAPFDDDARKLEEWKDSVLMHPDVRGALTHIADFGLHDLFRPFHPEGGVFSWWDYRQLGFQKNNGLRIDHVYATDSMKARCTAAYVDRDERKGKGPSDHAPVVFEFDDA